MDGCFVGIWQILADPYKTMHLLPEISYRFLQDNHFSARFQQDNHFPLRFLQDTHFFLPDSYKVNIFLPDSFKIPVSSARFRQDKPSFAINFNAKRAR